MKIGILTFHRSINYGAFIQCYALTQRIKIDFPEASVEVIDYTSRKTYIQNIRYDIKSAIKEPKTIHARIKKHRIFANAVETLPLSKEKWITDDYSSILKKLQGRYDAIIVGSDVVFNLKSRGLPNLYWLNEDLKCKKLTYAASAYGTIFADIKESDIKFCKEALSHFDFISVRDVCTEHLLNLIDDSIQYYHMCDPAILLNMEELKNKINITELVSRKLPNYSNKLYKGIIGIMSGDEEIGLLIKDRYPEYYKVSIYAPNKYADVYLYDLNPFEWAAIFSSFSLTLTTFFHGTLLSLRNNVPVIAVATKIQDKDIPGKVEDILMRLSLNNMFWQLSDIKLSPDVFYDTFDRLLTSPPRKQIEDAIAKESSNYDIFFNALKDMI